LPSNDSRLFATGKRPAQAHDAQRKLFCSLFEIADLAHALQHQRKKRRKAVTDVTKASGIPDSAF
jgi:hypothetical protein